MAAATMETIGRSLFPFHLEWKQTTVDHVEDFSLFSEEVEWAVQSVQHRKALGLMNFLARC